MRLAFYSTLLSACALTVLTGCEPNQLYMASHTVVGVNAAVNPDQTSGWLVVGYDRTFATVIPRSAPGEGDAKRNAMSAIACSRLAVNGITIKKFTESIATGKAAQDFAAQLGDNKAGQNNVKDFFSCFKNNPADQGGSNPGTDGSK